MEEGTLHLISGSGVEFNPNSGDRGHLTDLFALRHLSSILPFYGSPTILIHIAFFEPSHVFPGTLKTGPSLSFKILQILTNTCFPLQAQRVVVQGLGKCLTSHRSFLIGLLDFARVSGHSVSPVGLPTVFKIQQYPPDSLL